MIDKELFQETFSRLHASDSTCEEVIRMAEKRGKKRRRCMPKKAAVAIAFGMVVCGATVFAAGQSGFFGSIFGRKGQKDIEAHVVEDRGQSWTVPARDWVEVDEAAAEKSLGDHIGQLGDSVTVYGCTLTVEEYVIDESGIGAVTYTLSNPEGLEGMIYDAGYGECCMSPDTPLKDLQVWSTEGDMFDSRSILNKTESTDTELHAVLYFAPLAKLEAGEGIVLKHWGYEMDENGEILSEEEQSITFTPDSFAAAVEFESEEGYTAHISSLGILIDGPVFEYEKPEWIAEKMLITYEDGSVYQVEDTDVNNEVLGCYTQAGDLMVVFNRMADVDKVVSITVNGLEGDVNFTRQVSSR